MVGRLACLLILSLALPGVAAMAQTAEHEAPPPFLVAHGASAAIQKYSGITWLTNATASGIASAALSAKTHGRVHAKVKAYGLTGLMQGKFKSVEVTANGGRLKGVPFGKLHLASTNPFRVRYFNHGGKRSGMQTPVMVAVNGDISERDLARGLRSEKVVDNLRFLKLDLPGLGEQRLQVLDPKVDFVGDKIQVDSYLVTAGAPRETGVKLRLFARPLLEKERYIKLMDMKVESEDIQDSQNFGPFAEELFNPLIDFGRYDRLTHAFRLSKLHIADDRVTYSGKLLLAPKPGAPVGAAAAPAKSATSH